MPLVEYEEALATGLFDTIKERQQRLEDFRMFFSQPLTRVGIVRPTDYTVAYFRLAFLNERDELSETWEDLSQRLLTDEGRDVYGNDPRLQIGLLFIKHFYRVDAIPRDFVLFCAITSVRGKDLVTALIEKREPVKQERAFKVTLPNEPSKKTGAVAEVWRICDANPDLRRKEQVQLCVEEGININTAKTQVGRWASARKAGQTPHNVAS